MPEKPPVPGRRPFTLPHRGEKGFQSLDWRGPFTLPHAGKVFRFPAKRPLTFSHARKSLPVPGRRNFTFPHAGIVFWTLAGDLFYIPSGPEKSFGPWQETFNIFPCRKSLLDPGRRPFLHLFMPGKVFWTLAGDFCAFPHAWKVFWTLAGDLLHCLMREKSSSPLKGTFYFTPSRKSLPVPGMRLFYTPSCPEKSSGPWKETFYIPPCPEKSSGPWQETFFTLLHARKCLPVPGKRTFTLTFTVPHARKV